MTDEIRGTSANCLNKQHSVCVYRNCDCSCHRSELTLSEKIEALANSSAPDEQRLQVLISLTAELARNTKQ